MATLFQLVRDYGGEGEHHVAFFFDRGAAITAAQALVSATSSNASVFVFGCEAGMHKEREIVWHARGTHRLRG